jgi:hypothetical protein
MTDTTTKLAAASRKTIDGTWEAILWLALRARDLKP